MLNLGTALVLDKASCMPLRNRLFSVVIRRWQEKGGRKAHFHQQD